MKKINISIVLLFVMLLCTLRASATSFVIDDLRYVVLSTTDKTVSVSDLFSGTQGGIHQGGIDFENNGIINNLIIPSTVVYKGTTYTVTEIAENGFANIQKLSSVTIPSSITRIGDGAFSGCKTLEEIKIDITEPLSINANVFNDVDKSLCALCVPYGCMDSYREADVWKDFSSIKVMLQDGSIASYHIKRMLPLERNVVVRSLKDKSFDCGIISSIFTQVAQNQESNRMIGYALCKENKFVKLLATCDNQPGKLREASIVIGEDTPDGEYQIRLVEKDSKDNWNLYPASDGTYLDVKISKDSCTIGTHSESEADNSVVGDLNKDKEVTIADLVILIDILKAK